MIILGIDTSCDDTCIAVLEIKNNKFKILANIVSPQVKIHQKYGGVYPSLAKREHRRNLPIVLKKALKKANLPISNFKSLISKKNPNPKIQIPKIDLIAVTAGPGLEPCLWTGINFAKKLAGEWNIPIIPVNHIEAHIIVNWLSPINSKSKVKTQKSKLQIKNQNLFPAVALIVSGGHSQLILMKKIGEYKIIGETRDDAAGECLDKTARILGLPYPGGPAIAEQARQNKKQTKIKINLPRPMIYSKNYDFSFSGLKTAVLYDYKKRSKKVKESAEYVKIMSKEIQQAVIDSLIKKTVKAAKDFRAKTIILGGGVSANQELRRQFKNKLSSGERRFLLLIPPKELSTDNALMIALAGYLNRKKATKNLSAIKAKANLKI